MLAGFAFGPSLRTSGVRALIACSSSHTCLLAWLALRDDLLMRHGPSGMLTKASLQVDSEQLAYRTTGSSWLAAYLTQLGAGDCRYKARQQT